MDKDDNNNKAMIDILIWMNEFGSPTTKSIKYEDYFNDCFKDEKTIDLIKLASMQRDAVIEGLTYVDAKPDPRNVALTVDSYLPSLLTIISSLEEAGDMKIKMKKPLQFQWTSRLYKKRKEFVENEFVFEAAYTLMIKSIAHFDTACEIIQSSKSATNETLKIAEATQELRLGAGIHDYVSSSLLPKWNNPPKNRPHELMPAVVSTLSSIFQADAQRLTIAKAVLAGSPALLIAKLLLGCISRYDFAIRILRTLSRDEFQLIHDSIRDELGTMPAILRALASKYMGIASHECEKFGEAAAYMREAVRRFEDIIPGRSMKELSKPIAEELRSTKKLLATYVEECKNVYFVPIPPAQCLEFPDGSFVIKPVEFKPTLLPLVSFEESNRTCSISSEKKKGWFFSRYFTRAEKKREDGGKISQDPIAPAVDLPSDIDREAFNDLPKDVQDEILRQFTLNSQKGGVSS